MEPLLYVKIALWLLWSAFTAFSLAAIYNTEVGPQAEGPQAEGCRRRAQAGRSLRGGRAADVQPEQVSAGQRCPGRLRGAAAALTDGQAARQAGRQAEAAPSCCPPRDAQHACWAPRLRDLEAAALWTSLAVYLAVL